MPLDYFLVPDGLAEIEDQMSTIVDLIACTSRWVHPKTFQALPIWYPETARKQPKYNAQWDDVRKNTSRVTAKVTEKAELNVRAAEALRNALGTKKRDNWTVCHIWGVDDVKFQKSNTVVCDHRFYSCVGNMVWLPTPLKGFTDAVPSIKRMLRTCAFHLYNWACEHPDVTSEAAEIRSGAIPNGYPEVWPTGERKILPPNTAPFSDRVAIAIKKRKEELKRMLNDSTLTHFPRDTVSGVLEFWKITL